MTDRPTGSPLLPSRDSTASGRTGGHGHARTAVGLALGVVLFALLSTANSGGYRYGISDQAFYVPAVALTVEPSLFPRDRVVLAPQMRAWIGDSVLGGLARLAGGDLPTLFAALYAVTLLLLFAAGVAFARGIGADWWTVGTFLVLLTLRHRITKTGANSLEGYMHPRMLAFALGLAAFAGIVRRRFGAALVWIAAAAVVHTTTAIWFAVVLGVAFIWQLPQRRMILLTAAGVAVLTALALTMRPASVGLTVMDDAWIAVLGDKDYLFSARWPWYAWAVNLAYPVLLILVHRRRSAQGTAVPGEAGLIAGLTTLVVIFLLSVPPTEAHVAMAIQMQVNRVFWILDAVVALYMAWWITAELGRRWPVGAPGALVGALILASALRGYYVVRVESDRPLVELRPPAVGWTAAMGWLRTQPTSWHVLADPHHAWRFGLSVRVGAQRDTVLELNKDSAFAIYDRDLARRVVERVQALDRFDEFSAADVRKVAAAYGTDVFVDRAARRFEFPILYRNDEFIIYDLR